jgi:hypothetical protein
MDSKGRIKGGWQDVLLLRDQVVWQMVGTIDVAKGYFPIVDRNTTDGAIIEQEPEFKLIGRMAKG